MRLENKPFFDCLDSFNACAKNYKNPTVLFRVIAKNVRGSLFEIQFHFLLNNNKGPVGLWQVATCSNACMIQCKNYVKIAWAPKFHRGLPVMRAGPIRCWCEWILDAIFAFFIAILCIYIPFFTCIVFYSPLFYHVQQVVTRLRFANHY